MASRVPDQEIIRIKEQVDLVALVQSKGVQLTGSGKNLIGLSPFRKEEKPSFIVTPEKNLWHDMGTGKGGSVIDFVMHYEGVSFRHAYEILADGDTKALFKAGKPLKKARKPKLETPLSLDADDQTLLRQTVGYYRQRLQNSPAALAYLKKRGIGSQEVIDAFGIGYADRTLGMRLPGIEWDSGKEIRGRLKKIGLLREHSGHEHFNGCVVFPICDKQGRISEIYGRKINNNLREGTPYHLYLPGPHRGLFNPESFASREIILTESVIDALSFWCAGLKNVTCIWGTEGFSEDHLEAFKAAHTQKVYLAYDRDEAGERATTRDAERLGAIGIECYRVLLPHGMDANEYSLKVTPASKSLAVLVQGAQWLGKGPERTNNNIPLAANVSRGEAVAKTELAAKEEKEKNISVRQGASGEVTITVASRHYRVRGLEKNQSLEAMKINLRLMHEELFHVDLVDLYQERQRRGFIEAASRETNLESELIKRDLGKVLLKLEEMQESGQEPEAVEQAEEMSQEERRQALELLKSPNLLEKILVDFEACGIVGEQTNKLVGYLAAVSRKLKKPLAIVVQSTSAAGKTSLMEAVLAMMPEEERTKYSALTGQALYYLGESNLKHKILAIVEEEGAEKASYALKLLQSEGELTIASTSKDDNGKLVTEEYHVEGPVMIFLTTTAIDIDEELLNRCIVLSVDESKEQTEAIHRLQREAETLEGLQRDLRREKILRTHRNAQRLLKPLQVVNPYAPRLTFLSDRTRTRRDHTKYLTLIRTIALLHQHQREVKRNGAVDYIEVELSDIEAANKLCREVLSRSLDELAPQTRRLLEEVQHMAQATCGEQNIRQRDFTFTRREVRQKIGWSEFQVRAHLQKLEELEYVDRIFGRQGSVCAYRLLYGMNAEKKVQAIGLIETSALYDGNFEHPKSNFEHRNGHFEQLRDRGITKWESPSIKAPKGKNGNFVMNLDAQCPSEKKRTS